MAFRIQRICFDAGVFLFYCAGRFMRQRPWLKGKKHLADIPFPVICAVTHDSYFEIPSLSKVYRALKPKPAFSVMAKGDFLSGRYLSSNFRAKSTLLRGLMKALDRSGIPKLFFRLMNVATVHRPFIERGMVKKEELKQDLSRQMSHFGSVLAQGMSTLIFPEGTTWGYGGLKEIRSAAYQLVSGVYRTYGRKVYILPINVKVDRLVQGCKDVFINVGRPQFFVRSKEDFNRHLYRTLQRLHTITFSQIAAYYLKKVSLFGEETRRDVLLTKDSLTRQLEQVIGAISEKVRAQVLPGFDGRLVDRQYLGDKMDRFIAYCVKNGYLVKTVRDTYLVNREKVLALHPAKVYRKLNPVGFHANELVSLGRNMIDPLFDVPGMTTAAG